MRYKQYTITGQTAKMTVEYPNLNAFVNDNNFIEIVSPIEIIDVTYTITSGDTYIGNYSYRSPFKRLKISLNNIFNYVIDRYSDMNVTVNVAMTIKVGSQTFTEGSLFFNVLKGTSYPDRTHGSLYIYNYGTDPGNTEIYCPASGELTLPDSNTVNVSEGINYVDLGALQDTGVYNLEFRTAAFAPSCSITSVQPGDWYFYVNINYVDNSGTAPFAYLGDILHREEHPIDDYDIRYEVVGLCPKDTVKIKFFDADGCSRIVAGRIKSITAAGDKTDLLYEADIYNNIPNYAWTGYTKEMVVVFTDIAREFHLEDIYQSVGIWYENTDGNWTKCSLSTKNVKWIDDILDYELTFIINNR